MIRKVLIAVLLSLLAYLGVQNWYLWRLVEEYRDWVLEDMAEDTRTLRAISGNVITYEGM